MTSNKNPADNAGVWFPPPFIYVGVFLAGLVVQRPYPFTLLPPAIRRPLALLCVAAWCVVAVWSYLLFRRARTSVLPVRPTTAVIMSGPYAWSRNRFTCRCCFCISASRSGSDCSGS